MPNFLKDKFFQNSPFLDNSHFHFVFQTGLGKMLLVFERSLYPPLHFLFSVDGCHSHFTHQIVGDFRSWILRPFQPQNVLYLAQCEYLEKSEGFKGQQSFSFLYCGIKTGIQCSGGDQQINTFPSVHVKQVKYFLSIALCHRRMQ